MEGGLGKRDRSYYGVVIDDGYSILLTGTVKSAFGVLALVVCGFCRTEAMRGVFGSTCLPPPGWSGLFLCVFLNYPLDGGPFPHTAEIGPGEFGSGGWWLLVGGPDGMVM
jgi:hypothetical protein